MLTFSSCLTHSQVPTSFPHGCPLHTLFSSQYSPSSSPPPPPTIPSLSSPNIKYSLSQLSSPNPHLVYNCRPYFPRPLSPSSSSVSPLLSQIISLISFFTPLSSIHPYPHPQITITDHPFLCHVTEQALSHPQFFSSPTPPLHRSIEGTTTPSSHIERRPY